MAAPTRPVLRYHGGRSRPEDDFEPVLDDADDLLA